MTASARPPSLLAHAVTAWPRLPGAAADALARLPREGALFAFALLVSAGLGLIEMAEVWLDPATASANEDAVMGQTVAIIAASLFFLPLFLYAVSGFAGLVARAFGGTAEWKRNRLAFFWALWVSLPVIALCSLVGEAGGRTAEFVLGLVGSLAFGWVFSVAMAEAHGFRSALRVFAVPAIAGIVLLGLSAL